MSATESVTEAQTEQSGIIGTLGLKPDIFVAQLVNFLIIMFVLWKWAYKPLLKVLDDRAARIDRGLKDSETASEKLASIELEHAAALVNAREEAAEVIKDAHAQAEKKREALLAKTRDEVAKIVTDARRKISEEREQARQELKKEIGALVVATAEMVLKEKISDSADAKLMEPVLKKAKKKI